MTTTPEDQEIVDHIDALVMSLNAEIRRAARQGMIVQHDVMLAEEVGALPFPQIMLCTMRLLKPTARRKATQ